MTTLTDARRLIAMLNESAAVLRREPLPMPSAAGVMDGAAQCLSELVSEVERLRDALESIAHVHSMHCDKHVNISQHSHELAHIAEAALTQEASK